MPKVSYRFFKETSEEKLLHTEQKRDRTIKEQREWVKENR